MKNLKQIMLFVMVGSLLTFTSCSKDDDGDGDSIKGGSEFLTVKIDGASFSASTDPASLISAVVDSGVLAVQGSTNDGEYLRFNILNYTGTGTYTTGDALTNSNLIQYGDISTPTVAWISSGIISLGNSSATGTITVTSDDGSTIEGTFTFTGYNASDMSTKSFTEGEFKASIE